MTKKITKRPLKSKGRKSIYKKVYVKKLIDYFSIEPSREVEVVHKNKKGEEWSTYEEKANRLPTFERFASDIGVSVDALADWSKAKNKDGTLKYPEFSGAYKRAKQLQKAFLIANGTSGLFNATFTIFVAKNITDMRDKTEVDTTSGGEPIKITGFNYIVPKDRIDDSNTPTVS